MDNAWLEDALALKSVPGLGERSYKVLVDHYGSPGRALSHTADAWGAVLKASGVSVHVKESKPDRGRAAEVSRSAGGKGFWALCYGEPEYPATLAAIYDPPPVIFGLGVLDGPERGKIALVGSRRATTHGRAMAKKLSAELCAEGLTVVSGLAEGIDTEAHAGAVEAGGRTVAVLGSGLDVIYPRSNQRLYREILDKGGAVISELPPGAPPEPQNFPRRNRIISGLSLGVVVVEAAKKSGSLITASLALEHGREVFAMPGMARTASAEGANNLLRQGAAFAENAADVLDGLGLPSLATLRKATATALPGDLGPDAVKVFEVLEEAPMDVDAISQRAMMSAQRAGAALMELELAGIVRPWPGNRFSAIH